MRLVVIDHKDYSLFGEELSSATFTFFDKHRPTFDRMLEDQGHLFWRRYLVSFKAYCMDNELLCHPVQKGPAYRTLVLNGFDYLDMQLLHWSKAAARTKAFMDDLAALATWKHMLINIDSKKRAKDPFCMKECRDVYRKVFGESGLGPFARVKAWTFYPIYLRMSAALSKTLHLWMAASEIDEHDHSYWHPPPCDIFLNFSFSDEAFKLLPSEVDPKISTVNRQEISRLEREKYGDDAIDRFLPQLSMDPDKSENLSTSERIKGYKIYTLDKPDCCTAVEITSAPDNSRPHDHQDHGIMSFRLIRDAHHHSHTQAQYMRWKPADDNDDKIEEAVRSVIDLFTNEERKRFYRGIVGEQEKRKVAGKPPPESPLLNFFKEYSSAMSVIQECSSQVRKPYIYKRCSRCSKVEKEKKSFKICKICHDRNTERYRSYCSRDCQVSDWDRHRDEHKEIERIKRVIEDDRPEDWVEEFDRFSAGYFGVKDPDPEVEEMKEHMRHQIQLQELQEAATRNIEKNVQELLEGALLVRNGLDFSTPLDQMP